MPARRITRRLWIGVGLLLLLALLGAGQIQAQGESDLLQATKDKIAQYGPTAIAALQERYYFNKGAQLYWLGQILLCLMPLIVFSAFIGYPLFGSSTIARRLPGVPQGRLFKLYSIQGLVALAVLFVLGLLLWFIQFILASLADLTNPQLILQKKGIEYIVANRENLVNSYSSIFAGVADDLARNPDSSTLSIIIENGRELRHDPLLGAMASLFDLVWPLLSNLFMIAFALLTFSLLRRLWPDLRRMIQYPLQVLEAERQGRPLPVMAGLGLPTTQPAAGGVMAPPGQPGPPPYQGPPGYPPGPPMAQSQPRASSIMWAAGRRLMAIEFKVFLLFTITAIGLSMLMLALLNLFMGPLIQLLINLTAIGMSYFVSFQGASSVIAISMVLLVIFLAEVVVLFTAAFVLLLRKVSGAYRKSFADNVALKEAGRQTWRQLLRFGWAAGLAAVLGVGMVWLADVIAGVLVGGDTPAYGLTLGVVPLILLAGFNAGMWFLRGFKVLRSML